MGLTMESLHGKEQREDLLNPAPLMLLLTVWNTCG